MLFQLSTLPVGYLLDGAIFKWSLQMLGQITVCVPRDSIRVHNTLYLAPSVKMRFPIIVIPVFDLWLHANTIKNKCQRKKTKKKNNVHIYRKFKRINYKTAQKKYSPICEYMFRKAGCVSNYNRQLSMAEKITACMLEVYTFRQVYGIRRMGV